MTEEPDLNKSKPELFLPNRQCYDYESWRRNWPLIICQCHSWQLHLNLCSPTITVATPSIDLKPMFSSTIYILHHPHHYHDMSPIWLWLLVWFLQGFSNPTPSMDALTLRCYRYSPSVAMVPMRKTSRTTMTRASISTDGCSSSEPKKKSHSVSFAGKANKVNNMPVLRFKTYVASLFFSGFWNWKFIDLSGLRGQGHGNPLLHRRERWTGVRGPRRRPEADVAGHGEVSRTQDLTPVFAAACEHAASRGCKNWPHYICFCCDAINQKKRESRTSEEAEDTAAYGW